MTKELERKLKENQDRQLDEDINNLLWEIAFMSGELSYTNVKASEEINQTGRKLLDHFLEDKERDSFKQGLLALAEKARKLK